MSKGRRAQLGDENVAANGYHYVKTSTGWRLKHHLEAEKKLGRLLTDSDRVSFADNNRENFDHDNLVVSQKRPASTSGYYRRLTSIEDRMTKFVEDADDKADALQSLKDVLSDIRIAHKFSALP